MKTRNYERLNSYLHGLATRQDPEFDEDARMFIGSLEMIKPKLEAINEWDTVLTSIGALCAAFGSDDVESMSLAIGDTRETLERRLHKKGYAKHVIDLLSQLFVTGSDEVDVSWQIDMSGNIE